MINMLARIFICIIVIALVIMMNVCFWNAVFESGGRLDCILYALLALVIGVAISFCCETLFEKEK